MAKDARAVGMFLIRFDLEKATAKNVSFHKCRRPSLPNQNAEMWIGLADKFVRGVIGVDGRCVPECRIPQLRCPNLNKPNVGNRP